MKSNSTLSNSTRRNWMVDVFLFSSALLTAVSGLYFFFEPLVGNQGGQSALQIFTLIFNRHIWNDLHTIGGLIMVIVAVLHIVYHWEWVIRMAKRTVNMIVSRSSRLNARGWMSVAVNGVLGLSFLITAGTGVYFLFFAHTLFRGSVETFSDAVSMISLIKQFHIWGGILFTLSGITHFIIHWQWIINVTRQMNWNRNGTQTVLSTTETIPL